MGRLTQVSLSASGASAWIPLNPLQEPFSVGFGVIKIGTGDITFSVQHTFDNVLAEASAASIFDHPTVSGKTADIDGNYAFPCYAMRLRVTAVSGVATATLKVIQAGV